MSEITGNTRGLNWVLVIAGVFGSGSGMWSLADRIAMARDYGTLVERVQHLEDWEKRYEDGRDSRGKGVMDILNRLQKLEDQNAHIAEQLQQKVK